MTNKFGVRLKELRIELGLNQRQLAEKFKSAKSSISNYEKNNRLPDAETIIKYANFFGVTVDYILGLSDLRSLDELKENSQKDLSSSVMYKFFTERVKTLMFTNDLTAVELSKKVGLKKSELTEFILGFKFPTPELLKKISDSLGTSVSYLMGVVDDPAIKYGEDDSLSTDYIAVAKSAQTSKIPAKVLDDFIKLYVNRDE
ncbi:MAG: helix-turn-helix transcriptional regulator [Clostridiales bacterium]